MDEISFDDSEALDNWDKLYNPEWVEAKDKAKERLAYLNQAIQGLSVVLIQFGSNPEWQNRLSEFQIESDKLKNKFNL